MEPTLEDTIRDLHVLEARIRAYEAKYGMTTQDFSASYQAGLLDDEGFEQATEFTHWASAYAMKIERERHSGLSLDFDRWEALNDYGAARMRELCTERGIDWDRLTEDERLQLVDTLLHEDTG